MNHVLHSDVRRPLRCMRVTCSCALSSAKLIRLTFTQGAFTFSNFYAQRVYTLQPLRKVPLQSPTLTQCAFTLYNLYARCVFTLPMSLKSKMPKNYDCPLLSLLNSVSAPLHSCRVQSRRSLSLLILEGVQGKSPNVRREERERERESDSARERQRRRGIPNSPLLLSGAKNMPAACKAQKAQTRRTFL
jgi:hypothetical protein